MRGNREREHTNRAIKPITGKTGTALKAVSRGWTSAPVRVRRTSRAAPTTAAGSAHGPAARASARAVAVHQGWRPAVRGRETRAESGVADRSEEHTSELQSLMRISYAVFCLKKK